MKNVLVTGGAGFIGKQLVDELINTGRTVRIVGRRDRSYLNFAKKEHNVIKTPDNTK